MNDDYQGAKNTRRAFAALDIKQMRLCSLVIAGGKWRSIIRIVASVARRRTPTQLNFGEASIALAYLAGVDEAQADGQVRIALEFER